MPFGDGTGPFWIQGDWNRGGYGRRSGKGAGRRAALYGKCFYEMSSAEKKAALEKEKQILEEQIKYLKEELNEFEASTKNKGGKRA